MAQKSQKFVVLVESAKDKTLWGRIHYGDDLLTTSAKTEKDLIAEFQEQLEGFYDLKVPESNFEIQYDIAAYFEVLDVLNLTAIAKRAGINGSLLRQYKAGIKHPGKDQKQKLQLAIQDVTRQLQQIKLA